MKNSQDIKIGILGLGVVGSGVARILLEGSEQLSSIVGQRLVLKKVLVTNVSKSRSLDIPKNIITDNPNDILGDPEISIVIEVMGKNNPAQEYITRALSSKKDVITANKEVMARHGAELLEHAETHGRELLFEASVGGGIPIIRPLQEDFLANQISSIRAIINGTTNFILTEMASGGMDYQAALKHAQKLGYAERDPSDDVTGIDAAYKLSILASLAFHTRIHFDDVYYEGIENLEAHDFLYADELGFSIKLLAIAKKESDGIQIRVHPALVPQDKLLAKVDGPYNAIEITGDLLGPVTFHGIGAGSLPTTSSLAADLLRIAKKIRDKARPPSRQHLYKTLEIKSVGLLKTRHYIRMTIADQPGVLAQISRVLGNLDISIASVIQKDSRPDAKIAELVVMTHPSIDESFKKAMAEILKIDTVNEINTSIRVEPD